MGTEPGIRLAAVLYVSEHSGACERAVENVREVVKRVTLPPTTFLVRNVTREPLLADERAKIVVTPTLLTTVPSECCIASELDDVDALDRALRRFLKHA